MNPEVQQGLNAIRNWLASIKVSLPIDSGMTSEEKKQLQAVNRSIEQLQKLGVSIPDDLRNLKLRLTARDHSAALAAEIKNQQKTLDMLIEYLNDLKEDAKQIRHSLRFKSKGSGAKGHTHFGVDVADMIKAGFLSTESRLELKWKKGGEVIEGKLHSDGRIAVLTSSGWKDYESLSTAATQMAGRQLNGWETWRLLESNGDRIPLVQIRNRYMEASKL